MERRTKNILLHLAGSLLFVSVPFLNSQEMKESGGLPFHHEQQKDFIQFLLLLGFFYLNYLVLIPVLVFGRHYFIYTALIISCMLLIAYLPSFFTWGSMPPPEKGPGGGPGPKGSFFLSRINHNVFLFLAVVCFSLVLRIRERWQETERRKSAAELLYLKAQVNPHFLYNTLNSIYALALQRSEKTAAAVQELSSLMRYTLTESANETVPLKKEMEYIESYIHLQRLRFGNDISLHYEVAGDPSGKKIAPLLLIIFIENAFKYGVNAEESCEIQINIDILEKKLILMVKNKMVKTGITDENTTRLGLGNTRERLNLLYPAAHALNINEEQNYYRVKLSIDL